jgi:hypothetical protein
VSTSDDDIRSGWMTTQDADLLRLLAHGLTDDERRQTAEAITRTNDETDQHGDPRSPPHPHPPTPRPADAIEALPRPVRRPPARAAIGRGPVGSPSAPAPSSAWGAAGLVVELLHLKQPAEKAPARSRSCCSY